MIVNELNVNELRIPTETHFFLREPQYKNMWVQICGRATPNVPFKILSDEKLPTVGLLESEDKDE